jgi:CAAX protease family protein
MELQPVNAGESPDPVKTIFFNERGLRAGWRLLIFIAILLLANFLLGAILSTARSGRSPSAQQAASPVFVFISRAAEFAIFLLASWIMSLIERRPMGVYGLPVKNSNLISRFVLGYVFWGFLPLSVLLLIMRGLHVFYFGDVALHHGQIFYWAIWWWLAFLFVALMEEYFLRGYLLYTLADGIGFWPAAVFMAAGFGLLHASNPGESRIGVIMTVFFAMFASIVLLRTGNLWLAVGAHAGWDWGESYFYGVNDSGFQAPGHLLNPHIQGPDWLSGGTVGPEGSILALLVLTIMSILVWIMYRRRNEIERPVLYTMPLPRNE